MRDFIQETREVIEGEFRIGLSENRYQTNLLIQIAKLLAELVQDAEDERSVVAP
jgi:hypothetical protein